MKNVPDKSCGENQNTHFMFNNHFLRKTMPFMRWCGKIFYSRTDQRQKYGALHAGYLIAYPQRQYLCASHIVFDFSMFYIQTTTTFV